MKVRAGPCTRLHSAVISCGAASTRTHGCCGVVFPQVSLAPRHRGGRTRVIMQLDSCTPASPAWMARSTLNINPTHGEAPAATCKHRVCACLRTPVSGERRAKYKRINMATYTFTRFPFPRNVPGRQGTARRRRLMLACRHVRQAATVRAAAAVYTRGGRN